MLQWVAFCHALALSFAFASGMNPLLAAEPPLTLRWEINANPPLIASPETVSGGRIIASIDAFPLTLRQVGPDGGNGTPKVFVLKLVKR